MSYGLHIVPGDGGNPVDISSNCKLPSYVGYRSVMATGGRKSTAIQGLLPGSTMLVIPRQTYYLVDSGKIVPDICYTESIQQQGVNVIINSVSSFQDRVNSEVGSFDIFQIMGNSTEDGQYGIIMRDSSDFMSVTDSSLLGYVSFRGVVNINSRWSIPDIPNRNNCIVFARWNNQSSTLYFDRQSMSIQVWSNPSLFRMENNGTINGVQIVIISTGFFPPNPDGGWGLVIKNANGQNTYSSTYSPMIWRGASWNPPGGMDRAGTFTGFIGNVSKAMIPLCSLGVHMTNPRQGSYGNYHLTGMMMNTVNNTAAVVRAVPYASADANSGFARPSFVSGLILPVIDADDYF
nr:DUF6453 family protein [Pantoea sp. 201603H]